jgi:hypothetical protein
MHRDRLWTVVDRDVESSERVFDAPRRAAREDVDAELAAGKAGQSPAKRPAAQSQHRLFAPGGTSPADPTT